MVRVIRDFRQGKTTRRGRPLPPDEMPLPEVVTAVSTDVAQEACGCRTRSELLTFLRGQRARGRMICQEGRLTQRVRLDDGRHVRCYVFRGDSVPRMHPNADRVITW